MSADSTTGTTSTGSSSGAFSGLGGLVSGMDTQSIVNKLMAIQRQSYDKTSEKVQAEKVKLQAYQTVNSMLMALKTSVNSLSTQSLWNSKMATSSNESALKATASSSAKEGSYTFRTGKLATTAQYLSKGFSSKDSAVISPGSSKQNGTITLESSKARVDTSARLEDLNGGKGVFRGSIRITDGSNSSAVIDLSTCETIEEVIKAINGSAGCQVEARIMQNADGTSTGDRLEIVDKSGGTGPLKIQNVGQATTATDLGIDQTSSDGSVKGTSIFYMGDDTLLSTLNDGKGIEEGLMNITVKLGSQEIDVDIDLRNARTVSDITNAVNNAIKSVADGKVLYNNKGEIDMENGTPHPARSLLANLKLVVNDEGNGLTFTGGVENAIYTVTDLYGTNEYGQQQLGKPETVKQLGLYGIYQVDSTGVFGGSQLLGDISSPMLKNLAGANKTGIGSDSGASKVPAATFDRDTLLSSLNGGKGIGLGGGTSFGITLYEHGGQADTALNNLFNEDELLVLANKKDATVGELLDYLNYKMSRSTSAALTGMEFKIDPTTRGIYIDGMQSSHTFVFSGNLATSLGLDGTYTATNAGMGSLNDLYTSKPIGPNGGNVFNHHKLSEIFNNGALLTQQQIDDFIANGMDLVIGTSSGDINVHIDMSAATADTDMETIMGYINGQIITQVAAANPNVTAPRVNYDFSGNGLIWTNVDESQKLHVSGDAAEILGLTQNFNGETVPATTTTVKKSLNPVETGTSTPIDLSSGQKLVNLNGGSGLTMTGNHLTLAFGPDDDLIHVSVTRDELIAQLGGNFLNATVQEYTDALTTLFNSKIAADSALAAAGASVTFGVSTDGHGITITNAKGRTPEENITLGGDMATAASTGLAPITVKAEDGSGVFTQADKGSIPDIRGVTSNPATVEWLGTITIEINNGVPPETLTLDTENLDENSTLNDLIGYLNKQLADANKNMSFGLNSSGTGLSFTNNSGHEATIKYDEVNSLASDLGLVGKKGEKTDTVLSNKSYHNGTSVNRNYIDRATSLSTLNGGAGADKGVITVTNHQGTTVNIDLSECVTVGDVIDAINGLTMYVNARINDAGDGILIEQVNSDSNTSGTETSTGNISIVTADGTKTAEHLGIAGTGKGGDAEKEGGDGYSRLDGSMKVVIDVGPNDSLTDLMTRIANANAGYKTSIINDGTGENGFRLSIDAKGSGAGNDFVIDTDLDFLGLTQVAKGQDSMLLYGQPNSGMSPVVLKSSTNTNNKAIAGLTLELVDETENYTTITVKNDTEKVVEEIQNMVQTYNDLSDLITYLDAYDYEADQKGILFGDTTIRTLMETIDDMFYGVFNPDNLTYKEMQASGKKSAWTWADMGISFSTNNTASDGTSGSWFSRMDLDVEALNEMVSNNWEEFYNMMASQRNASSSKLAKNAAATATFNFKQEYDDDGNPIENERWDPNNAINNDKSNGNWGATNGFTANKTIEEGENEYTIFFQGNITLDRVTIYHPNSVEYPASEYALKNFKVEYLNANTGKWEVMREFKDNKSSSTVIGVLPNTVAQAIRITGTETNAADGKFRLLDVQCLESVGLVGKLNQTVNRLTDVVDGYFTRANKDVEDKIKEMQDQMEKMAERLEEKEKQLWNKFSAMETALSKMKNQGDYLTNYFASANSK